jgi:hypothetical protein
MRDETMTRITRRTLAGAILTPAALAQTQAPIPRTPDEELAAIREQNGRNSEALAKLQVPIATEPAFQFKA